MKMEKAALNLFMETCFLPEEICGADLNHWNRAGLQERSAPSRLRLRKQSAIKSATSTNDILGFRGKFKFLFESVIFDHPFPIYFC